MHNQIDNILLNSKRHSNTLHVQFFRPANCDTDNYLVVAKIRERLAMSKQTTHIANMERFNLKKLNTVEGKEQYRVESQKGSQLWKTYTLRLILIKLGRYQNFKQKQSRLL
jgi:hypothetical protein